MKQQSTEGGNAVPPKTNSDNIFIEKYGKIKNDKQPLKDVGTPHFNAHKTMEEFWSQYRKGGEKYRETPTCGEYTKALYKSLQDAGLSKEDAFYATKEAIKQRRQYGLTYDTPVPRIPGPMNSLKKFLFKNIP